MTDCPSLTEQESDRVQSERIQAAARLVTCDPPDDFPPAVADDAGMRRALVRFAAGITVVACAAAIFIHFAKH